MPDIEKLIRRYDAVKSDRGVWESQWEEIAERILPRQMGFIGDRTRGEKRMEKVFDSTPIIALGRFSSVMDSLQTPRQSIWHYVQSNDPAINRDFSVRTWFEEVRRVLFLERYQPKANFTGQNSERWTDMGAFGNGTLFTDWDKGLRYRHIALKDLFFLENHQGMVDTVFRRFMLTARQAAQQFGIENCHEKIQAAMSNPSLEMSEFEFVHVTLPNDEYDDRKADYRGAKIASVYICMTARKALGDKAGYGEFPYSISRYSMAPGEVYGRGPGGMALPDIKMLNEMAKTDISAAHKLINPPLLVHDDGIMGGGAMNMNLTPGGINFGGVSRDGRALIQPLSTGARVDIADSKMEQRRQSINDAFLVTLFQILIETPRMSATEALIRSQEKAMLLTPTVGRQSSEALGPMIERELELLMRHGKLPPMPGLLLEAQGEYEIVFDSPMSRMQRAEELVGIQRTMETLTPYAQIDPTVMDVFDPDQIAQLTAEVSGMPMKTIRSPDDIAKIRADRKQQEDAMREAEMAQPMAGAMKDIAQAQQISGGGA